MLSKNKHLLCSYGVFTVVVIVVLLGWFMGTEAV